MLDEDQQILDVLKYNQDRMIKLDNLASVGIQELDKISNESKKIRKNIDCSISDSLHILEQYGVNIQQQKQPKLVEEVVEHADDKMKEKQSKNWNELVNEARIAGYNEVPIEEVLTAVEMSNADARYEEIKAEFRKKTKLGKIDISFLFLAIALQCARQYILSNEKFRFKSDKDGEKVLKKAVPKSWQDFLFASVPYDAVKRLDSNAESTGISGNTHRYRTLGHDPVLGWIFGPVNILSSSLTKSDFITTYEVQQYKIGDLYPMGTLGAMHKSIEVAQEDKYNMPAAVLRQAVHFGTDYFTKQGLPIPFVSTLNNDLSKTLTNKYNIDSYSVMRGASVSIMINSIIGTIHKLFYNEEKDGSPEIYEVRTRKILLLANTIATTSNAIYVALSKDLKKLDVGGMLVTIYRLISDTKFIIKVKEEFIHSHLAEDLQKELDYLDELLAK